jgi:hypothetical protein
MANRMRETSEPTDGLNVPLVVSVTFKWTPYFAEEYDM